MATHTFSFHESSSQMIPYVAQIVLNDKGQWRKLRKPLESTEVNGQTTTSGNYEVEDGEVIESGYGKRRQLFIVREGEFIALGVYSPESKGIVDSYLRGEITADDVYYMPPSLKHY